MSEMPGQKPVPPLHTEVPATKVPTVLVDKHGRTVKEPTEKERERQRRRQRETPAGARRVSKEAFDLLNSNNCCDRYQGFKQMMGDLGVPVNAETDCCTYAGVHREMLDVATVLNSISK